MSDNKVHIRTYVPGDASYVSYMHMKYYGEYYSFKPVFEYYVIKGITEFLHNPSGSNLWMAEAEGRAVGSIAIVKTQEAAQLRWFLVDKEYQGIGIGRKLMNTALNFCKDQGYNRVFLWTGSILKVARYLYKDFGFSLTEENTNTDWADYTITEERWELNT